MNIGPKMATPQDENRKNPKNGPRNPFFLNKGPFFLLMKPVPESPHQTCFFGRNQYIGTLIFS